VSPRIDYYIILKVKLTAEAPKSPVNKTFFPNDWTNFGLFLYKCSALFACLQPIRDPDRIWEAAERQALVNILENILVVLD